LTINLVSFSSVLSPSLPDPSLLRDSLKRMKERSDSLTRSSAPKTPSHQLSERERRHSKARRRSNWMVGSKSSEHPLIRFLPSSFYGVQCFSRLLRPRRHRKRNSVSLEWKSRRTRQKRQRTREMLRKSNTAISRQFR